MRRIKVGVPLGDTGDETLKRLIRAQGNFIEYTPIALIALALVEYGGASAPVVTTLGAALALGRILHALGILSGSTPIRALGILATYAMLLSAAVRLVLTTHA